MKESQRLDMISEIKDLERELYRKKSRLAAEQTMEGAAAAAGPATWRQIIEEVGALSTGGNSVEDVRLERGQ